MNAQHKNLKTFAVLVYGHVTVSIALKGLAQAKIIKKIGDFISASKYDHMV